MSKNLLLGVLLSGASAYAGDYGSLVNNVGGIAGGLLLAHYSREDERQADALGMEYMTKAAYNPDGMVELMELLRGLSRRQPGALEIMFSTHPMSEERYETALSAAQSEYASFRSRGLERERYMDHTVSLRKKKGALDAMQKAEEALMKKQYTQAEDLLQQALKEAPGDYACLVMMAKCLAAQGKKEEARGYAQRAKEAYPEEAQAYNVGGIANLMDRRFEAALADFSSCERLLPGNPNMIFFKGLSLEGMNNKKAAADEYIRYLNAVGEGKQAQYAYQRLVDWGYARSR